MAKYSSGISGFTIRVRDEVVVVHPAASKGTAINSERRVNFDKAGFPGGWRIDLGWGGPKE